MRGSNSPPVLTFETPNAPKKLSHVSVHEAEKVSQANAKFEASAKISKSRQPFAVQFLQQPDSINDKGCCSPELAPQEAPSALTKRQKQQRRRREKAEKELAAKEQQHASECRKKLLRAHPQVGLAPSDAQSSHDIILLSAPDGLKHADVLEPPELEKQKSAVSGPHRRVNTRLQKEDIDFKSL